MSLHTAYVPLATSSRRCMHVVLVLALLVGLIAVPAPTAHAQAPAAHMFDNGLLRFGGGGHQSALPQMLEASINPAGNLLQPFYWSPDAGAWNKLTYSSYPLDIAVGAGTGDNWSGSEIVENPTLTDQVVDTNGFVATSTDEGTGTAVGHGTMSSTGTLAVADETLEIRSTYELGESTSFVKITTSVRNVGVDAADNLNLWVGTRDDWVGNSDRPTKTKGNLVDGAFEATSDATTPGAALRITSEADGVLFYSTTEGTNTSISNCCSLSNAYDQSPTTSPTTLTGDGSYALHLPVGDLAVNASAEIVWYYAAGPLSALDEVIRQVADAAAPPRPTVVIGDGQATVTWLPATSEDEIVGYVLRYRPVGGDPWVEVRVSAEPPLAHIVTGLVNGTSYEFEVAAVTMDGEGEVVGEWSPTSEESAPGLPVNQGRPAIVGEVRVGQTVRVVDADWVNTRDGEMTASYQWQVDGVDIEGATGTTFEVTAEHVGRRLQVVASRTNDVGIANAASRALTVPAVPLLSGITTSIGTLAPAFAPATTSYGFPVPMAATNLDLRLATATPGATIRVDGTPVSSWMPVTVPLRYGRNDVTVQVTSPGGTTNYTISITRPSPASPSAPAPKPTTPVPPVVVRDPVGQLPRPGTGEGTVAGQRVTLEVAPNAATRGVAVRGPGFELDVAPAAGEANPNIPPAATPPGERPAADMTFTRGEGAQVTVRGFAARTPVRLWLFSEPTLLGEFETDGAGALAAVSDIVGDDVAACRHTVHAEGQLSTGEAVELSLGVWVDAKPYPYRDVATASEHARAVACLRDLDVIRGTGADTFDPRGDLQRGQAATLVARLLGLPLDGTPAVSDAASSTHRGGIAAALEAGLLTGFADGSFRPGVSITRGQLASLLAAAADLDREVPSAFADTTTSVHAGAIAALAQTGIVSGFGDGSFRPGHPVSRDQAASMLHRFVEWREAAA